MKHIIIGNGIAGTTAALSIRKFDPAAELLILSEEPVPFYSRIRLIDYLAGEVTEDGLILYKDAWYERNAITLLLNTRVAGIAPGRKEISLVNGRKIGYDRLLVAAGSTPFVPPPASPLKKGVFTLKTLDDALIIKDFSQHTDTAIILGGGVLGIEAGNALRKAGKKVSIVEFFPRLLPKQLDAEGAEVLQKRLETIGFRFFLNAKAREVKGGPAVEGLALEDGRVVRGGMIIVSTGIRCNTALLQGTGALLGKGVVVNDRMETTLPDVYAAGDLAEHRGIVYGLWPAAEQQGEAAGINMAGGNAVYTGTLPSNILKVAGVEFLSAGNIDPENTMESLTGRDDARGIYRKLVIDNGCVVGCILCGDKEGRKEVLAAVREKREIGAVRDILDRLQLTRRSVHSGSGD
ncbi:MAG: FAD-dependent oxidoreductase [Nitrospirota bacterium]